MPLLKTNLKHITPDQNKQMAIIDMEWGPLECFYRINCICHATFISGIYSIRAVCPFCGSWSFTSTLQKGWR